MITKVAIIGATGMLGQPVTKEFIQNGFEVTLLVRDINKAKVMFGPGVKLVKGDVADLAVIKKLLIGQDALYLNLSVDQASRKSDFQPEREGLNNILSVAKVSGIKRIGYLSSLLHRYHGQDGFTWWVFEIKRDAVASIKSSGLTYSIFYPSTFMESFDKGAYRQGDAIALAGTSRYKMFLIAGTDYGKQVVKAFQLDNGNQEYVVQGQDGYTADEAATCFIENYRKRKIKLMKAPLWLLSFLGVFKNKFNYGAKIITALNNYPETFAAENTWKDLGKPQTRFIDYAKNSD
jgi:uncharacterized protein YbjT (DUF2867 family)